MRLTHSDSEQAKLDSFLRDWPLERVKRMTLDEYTRHGGRDTFTYALERNKTPVGMGGGTPFKFGIYAHNPNSAEEPTADVQHKKDPTYSWRGQLGDSAQAAFLNARQAIVNIIESVRRGELVEMDNETIGRTFARKIAFLYQSPELPMLAGCFVDEAVLKYVESLGVEGSGMSLAKLHQAAIGRFTKEDNLQSIGLTILHQYNNMQKNTGTEGVVEEEQEDLLDDTPQMWHYTFDHKSKDTAGLNDLESLLRLSEINIQIDCDDLSDLPVEYKAGTTEATRRVKARLKAGDDEPKNTGLMAWHIAKRMQVGDLIFARVRFENSSNFYFIYGRVSGDYRYESNRPQYRHARSVIWLKTDDKTDRTSFSLQSKALTLIRTGWLNERKYVTDAFKIDLAQLPPIHPNPTCEIFYGPPGTGKTFNTRRHAIEICLGKGRFNEKDEIQSRLQFEALRKKGQVEFVTFHQSFDYSDFVVGFKPATEGSTMVFKPKPGVLLRIAKRARENPEMPYLLIMDEVNRGNISKIFGELITLVEKDKRAGKDFALTVTLPCSCLGYLDGENHDQFSLPPNVHLLGTMNTADRSIAQIDSALRRRFVFTEMKPQPLLCPKDIDGINVQNLLIRLNKTLGEKLTREHQVGHSELMFKPARTTGKDVADVVNRKIIPQIDEWLHDDPETMADILGGFAKLNGAGSYATDVDLLLKYTA